MKARKILVSLAALALVAALSIGGTIAYLTSQDTVTNTFTVGKVAITLDEAKVNLDGEQLYYAGGEETDKTVYTNVKTDSNVPAGRVKANDYKLMPGHTYLKDPTVYVEAESEDSWIFVKVTNPIANLEDKTVTDGTIAAQIAKNGWTQLKDASGNDVAGVYYKEYTKAATKTTLNVFNNFKLADDANTTAIENGKSVYEGAQIVVNAYAVQKDGFNDVLVAWTTNFANG